MSDAAATFSHQKDNFNYNYNIVSEEGIVVTAHVDVAKSDVEAEVKSQIQNYAKRVSLPGFRQGKVPLKVVEQKYGEGIKFEVLEQAARAVGPDVISVEENAIGIRSIEPHPDGEESEQAYRFQIVFERNPAFELDVPTVELTRPKTDVSDDERDERINALLAEQAEREPKEGAAAEGDLVTVNIAHYHGEHAHGEPQDSTIRLGQAQIHADLDSLLVGKSAGDDFEITVTAQAGQPHEGEQITYKGTVVSVATEVIPTLDDEFATKFDGIENADDLREKMKLSMIAERDRASNEEARKEVIDALKRANEFDLPESFVSHVQRQKAQEFMQSYGQQPWMANFGSEEQKNQFAFSAVREAAASEVHTSYILEKLAEHLNIEATDGDVEKDLEAASLQYGQPVEQLKQSLGESGLRGIKAEIRNNKALQSVLESATVTEVSWDEWQALQVQKQADLQAAAQQQAAESETAEETAEE